MVRNRFLTSLILLAIVCSPFPATTQGVSWIEPSMAGAGQTPANADPTSSPHPLLFVPNLGQFDPHVHFQAHTSAGTLWLTDNAVWLTVTTDKETRGAQGTQGTQGTSGSVTRSPCHLVTLSPGHLVTARRQSQTDLHWPELYGRAGRTGAAVSPDELSPGQ